MVVLAFGLAALGALFIVGCGGGHGGGDSDVASVEFALQGGDFTGNSVAISGKRVKCGTAEPLEADSKYRCDNAFKDQCFNFDQQYQTFKVDGLCPSEDVEKGCWTFTYKVYTEANCQGTLLNADRNPNNFACYDSHDVYHQDHPNMSFSEEIHKGENHDAIVCKTENASKDFVFSSCAILRKDTTSLVLDCGCAPSLRGDCQCEGLNSDDLTPQNGTPSSTCSINPNALPPCSVTCCDDKVDFQSDPNNCGSCGHACGTAQICRDGICL